MCCTYSLITDVIMYTQAKTINKSLSALGNVINALTDGKPVRR